MEGRHLVRSRLSVTFMELLLFTSEEPEDVRDVSHPQGHVRAGSSAPGGMDAGSPALSWAHPPAPSTDCSPRSPYLCSLGPGKASLALTKCEH